MFLLFLRKLRKTFLNGEITFIKQKNSHVILLVKPRKTLLITCYQARFPPWSTYLNYYLLQTFVVSLPFKPQVSTKPQISPS